MNEKERQLLGKRVTKARTDHGWSKEVLAEKASITTTTLRRIEDGLRVQDAKLAQVTRTLELDLEPGEPERPEREIHPGVFVLPPEIERGYESVVRFTRAVATNVPDLAPRATRLMVDAAGLFAEAADALLAREGGEEHVQSAGGSPATNEPAPGPADQPGTSDPDPGPIKTRHGGRQARLPQRSATARSRGARQTEE